MAGTEHALKKRRWGMAIDLDRCTGCGACVAACKVENNVPDAPAEQARAGRVLQWVRVARHEEPDDPHEPIRVSIAPCYHCGNAPCTLVCPVHATYKGIDGIVGQTYYRCIGCRYCMAACPYTVKVFNWYAPEWSGVLREHTNPDVTLRMKGVVEKCTFCSHRLMKARDDAAVENRDVREEEYQPACAESCPARAITFGDLLDPESRISRLRANPRVRRLLEELGTDPSVFYLSERERRVEHYA